MGFNSPKISKKIKKQLNKIETDSFIKRDIKNKLEIFAVKYGIKPAFLGWAYDITPFKQIALLLKLKYKETEFVPPYMTRKPNVDNSFWKASLEVCCGGLALWVYLDDAIESMISECLSGKLNPGLFLGYPECCIRWHESIRATEIESSFHRIKEIISKDPNLLNKYNFTSEEEMYIQILFEWKMPMPHYALETHKRFPFVPHYACPSCLNGESKATEKINLRYKELATKLYPSFVEILEESI